MKFYEILTPDFEHADGRGKLSQLTHGGYRQINVLSSKKGVTRGGHYHKASHEAFFVADGSVAVTFAKDGETETVTFEENAFFEIPPLVSHSMYFPEDCILVAMYDIPVEKGDGTKDIYPA